MSNKIESLKQKKRHRDGIHRWSKEESLELLQAVLDAVKDNPECFEKPTAKAFYSKLLSKHQSSGLKSLGISLIKNKMRHLRRQYTDAVDWRGKTGAGLLEEGKFQSVNDYILRICPHFGMLDELFGQRKNVNLPVNCDTNTPFSFEDAVEYCPEEEEDDSTDMIEVDPETMGLEEDNNPEIVTMALEDDNDFSMMHTQSSTPTTKPARKKPQKSNSSLAVIQNLQKERLLLEREKFEHHKAVEASKLAIQEKELELKREESQTSLQLKKMQIEKEFELRKLELELKYNVKRN